jgi:hypothetical protein
VTRPGSTLQYTAMNWEPWVGAILVDVDGLDSNQTIGPVNVNDIGTSHTPGYGNIGNTVQPIAGPATVRIYIKPRSARSTTIAADKQYWGHLNSNTWDFQASEGYVTFRIVGSEKEVSKKFATVIPENSSGNVDIILEQSTDLINWSAVNPGSFPPSTAKRFFRVRSQE